MRKNILGNPSVLVSLSVQNLYKKLHLVKYYGKLYNQCFSTLFEHAQSCELNEQNYAYMFQGDIVGYAAFLNQNT